MLLFGVYPLKYGLIALLVICLFTSSLILCCPAKANSVITVPDDYLSIQEAVNNAKNGDTILVKQGVYHEAVVLDKSLTLKGIGYPVINADRKGSAIMINASNCIVDGFKVTNSMRSFSEGGVKVQYYSGGNNIIKNNIAYGNTLGIYAMKTAHNSIINNTVFDNSRGIECWVETDDYIASNTVYSNGEIGILLSSTGNSSVLNNVAYYHTEAGIMLDGCDDSYVKGNSVFSNLYGIYWTYSASRNLITENNITNNQRAFTWYCKLGDNHLYHNTIKENTINYEISYGLENQTARNFWNDWYPSGGNYWSDYNGTDSNNDGIGDSPYIIAENNIDNYPLMNPYKPLTNEFLAMDIISNSTITALHFDTSNRIVSFNAQGPTGTSGFTEIVIPKTVLSNPEDFSILLDNKPIEYCIKSVGDRWFLLVDYSHSSHDIVLKLGSSGVVPEFSGNFVLLLLTSLISIMAVGVVIHNQRRKTL